MGLVGLGLQDSVEGAAEVVQGTDGGMGLGAWGADLMVGDGESGVSDAER